MITFWTRLNLWRKVQLAVAWFVSGSCLAICTAADIPIINPGFEQDIVNPKGPYGPLVLGQFQTTISGNFHRVSLPSGWDLVCPDPARNYNLTNTVGVLDPTTTQLFNLGHADGQVALIYLESGSQTGVTGPEIGLRQITEHRLKSFTRYHLKVDVGNIKTDPVLNTRTGILTDLAGFPGYRIELWAGSQRLAFDDWDGTPGSPKAIGEGEFRTVSIVYTSSFVPVSLVSSPPKLEVRLLNLNRPIAGNGDNAANNAGEVNFDNVSLWSESVIQVPSVHGLDLGIRIP